MSANKENDIEALRQRIQQLERENQLLRKGIRNFNVSGNTVSVPKEFEKIFKKAQTTVGEYFTGLDVRPSEGTIEINGQRYVLVRASALSYEFFNKIRDLYSDRGEEEAILTGKNFLFDIAHVIGIEDARNFHKVMKLEDPVERLSAGPVHFAYSGWAFVDILAESRPITNDDFYLKYNHPYSFEADSWIKEGKKSNFPVCIMNSGYSSGWCEESFGMPLTAVEISCRACGDENCTFIMAPPHRIAEYLEKETEVKEDRAVYDIPMFFERKKAEEKIRASLKEKEMLLKEIHHRVKNNLQIISSLLKLQASYLPDPRLVKVVNDSQNRIKTMAIVHEKLYQSNLGSVNIGDYISSIIDLSIQSYGEEKTKIKIDFSLPAESFDVKIDLAIPVGLIANEILINAFKYAFENRAAGTITVKIYRIDPENLMLEISDNGVGLPKDIDVHSSKSFGMELISLLTEQIDGKLELIRDNGTAYKIEFPILS